MVLNLADGRKIISVKSHFITILQFAPPVVRARDWLELVKAMTDIRRNGLFTDKDKMNRLCRAERLEFSAGMSQP